MKAYLYLLLTFVLFFQNSVDALGPILREPKILVLIISSNSMQAYIDLQGIWKQYMNSDPEHFEVYFIAASPDLATPYEIKGNYLTVKGEESYVPGIIDKTMLALETMQPRLKEFDYVLRTNLSSFYVFPRLLNFVKTLPKYRCYCGVQLYLPETHLGLINFVSGAGILLSRDLAQMLINEKDKIFKINKDLPDDVLIGYFFQNAHIASRPAQRTDFPTFIDWAIRKNQIPANSFHFRAKNNYNQRSSEENFNEEIAIDKELLKMFYPKTTPIK